MRSDNFLLFFVSTSPSLGFFKHNTALDTHSLASPQVLAKKAGPAVEIPPEMEKKFEVRLGASLFADLCCT